MKVYIESGHIPEQLLGNWQVKRGDRRVARSVNGSSELWLPPEGLVKSSEVIHQASIKWIKDDDHDFGGAVRRRISVRPGAVYDLVDDYIFTWNTILSPIMALEAWRQCVSWKMELQGICLFDGTVTYRFYKLADLGEQSMYAFIVEEDGKVLQNWTDKFRDAHRERFVDAKIEGDTEVYWPKMFETPHVSAKMIELLMCMDDFPTIPLANWRVSGVWRVETDLLLAQARLFDMTLNQLVTRLERRQSAAERKHRS